MSYPFFLSFSVGKKAFVEAVDLLYKLCGMHRSIVGGLEGSVLARLVSPEHQQVAYAQELEVEQHVFQVLTVVAAAHDMGHHRDVVLVL